MKFALSVSLLLVSVFLSPVRASQAGPTEGLQRISGTGIWLSPPDDFFPAGTFAGFEHTSYSTILAMEFDAPFDEMAADLTDPDKLRTAGVELVEAQPSSLGEFKGFTLFCTQSAGGIEFTKIIRLFGNSSKSVLINFLFPVELEEDLRPKMLASMDSIYWDPDYVADPLSELGFKLGDRGGLLVRKGVAGSLALSEIEGIDPSGLKAYFACTPSIGLFKGPKEAFARLRVGKTTGHKQVKVDRLNEVTIDGLSGLEISATALDEDSGAVKSIYQVVLFDGSGYWLLQGLVETARYEDFLPRFKRIARSFERKWVPLVDKVSGAKFEVPANWSLRAGLSEVADLEARHAVGQQAVMYLAEAKSEAAVDSMRQYLRAVSFANGDLKDSDGVVRKAQVAGRKALILEGVNRDASGNQFFRQIVIEGTDSYHQLVFTCPESFKADCIANFDAVQETLTSL